MLLVAGLLAAKPAYRTVQQYLYPLGYSEEVERWAAEYGLDPCLLYAFIRTESGFRPGVQSSAGAIGLMQITEDTFDWLKGRIAPDEPLAYDDLYDPGTAVRFGAYYIKISLERYGGDLSTAAAAYHSGWGTVDHLLAESDYTHDSLRLHTFPYSQMGHYVNKINSSYTTYVALYGNQQRSKDDEQKG